METNKNGPACTDSVSIQSVWFGHDMEDVGYLTTLKREACGQSVVNVVYLNCVNKGFQRKFTLVLDFLLK